MVLYLFLWPFSNRAVNKLKCPKTPKINVSLTELFLYNVWPNLRFGYIISLNPQNNLLR